MKPDESNQMIHLRIEMDLLKKLDDFRFEERFFNRSDAIRWLLDWALEQKPRPPKSQAERFPS